MFRFLLITSFSISLIACGEKEVTSEKKVRDIFISTTQAKLINFKKSPSLFLFALLILFFSVFTITKTGLYDKKILLFIVTIVVITDIFGFVFGRLFAGPKVMPSISPGKTW